MRRRWLIALAPVALGVAISLWLNARDRSPLFLVTVDLGTLQDVLRWHAAAHGERTHIYLYGEDRQPEKISYQALLRGSLAVAQGLRVAGVDSPPVLNDVEPVVVDGEATRDAAIIARAVCDDAVGQGQSASSRMEQEYAIA